MMKKGKATRVYSVDKEKLAEAIRAIDEFIRPIMEKIEEVKE